jgi:hypothetical protein
MKKYLLLVFMLALAGTVFAEEYKIFCSGKVQGLFTVTKDTSGKITIVANTDVPNLPVYFGVVVNHNFCPLVPEVVKDSIGVTGDSFTYEIVVDGNTTTVSSSNGNLKKIVIDGNTTTTFYYSESKSSPDWWSKLVFCPNQNA